MGVTYLDVLDAVKSYYGSGSDQWLEIARYGVRPDNIDIVKQVPGVNVYTYTDGSIANITYNNPFSIDAVGIGEEINSNAQSGSFSQLNSFSAEIPSTSALNQSTGTYDMASGSTTVSGGTSVATVARAVSTGIAAVTAGCRLGKFFAAETYAQNPDYWDEHLPGMNPETWSSIAGDNELGQKVMQFLFGIDPNTNETTAYMDEDAFAYMAYAMAQLGMFSGGSIDNPTNPYTVNTSYTINPKMSIRSWCALNYQYLANSDKTFFETMMNAMTSAGIDVDSLDYNIMFIFYSSSNFLRCWVFPAGTIYTPLTVNMGTTYTTYSPRVSVRGGIFGRAGTNINVVVNDTSDIYCGVYGNTKYKFILNNFSITVNPTVPGVSDQPGSTNPNTSTWTDPQTTKQSLQQQHPEFWDGAIQNTVPQEDGTTKTRTYIKVPTIATNGKNEKNPVNTTVTSGQTIVSPSNSTEELLNTIVRYITDTTTSTPSQTPTDTGNTNPPDTGSGDTPTLVMPSGGASRLWSVYNPTDGQLNSFGSWLWSSNFIEQIKKLFNDPMQAIIGVHKVFVEPNTSGTSTIVCGYIDSEVPSKVVSSQYKNLYCGSVNLREYFGNVFDYDPHTEVKLFLPFIGIVDLDVAYVMRSKITINYHVDVITGACLAEVSVQRDGAGGVIYTFGGSCIVQYPVSSGSYMGIITSLASGAASVAMAGFGAYTGNPMAVAFGASGAINSLMSPKTKVSHSGGFSGCVGAMGGKKPYLIIRRPQTALNGHEPHMAGSPSNDYTILGNKSGFVKCKYVHVDRVNRATASEKEEIVKLLKEGVLVN